MLDKLRGIDARYLELERMMTLPSVTQDGARFQTVVKEYNSIEEVVLAYRTYLSYEKTAEDAKALMADPDADAELRSLAEEEMVLMKEKIREQTELLKLLLIQ